MLSDLVLGFAALTAVAATGFVGVAVFWLKKLRETMSLALAESASQQVRAAQRLNETVGQMQKQQQNYEQQLQGLTQANVRLRQEVLTLNNRMEHSERELHLAQPSDRTLH